MKPDIKALDPGSALALPLGSPLVICWFEDGERSAAAQLVAKKSDGLTLNVWRSAASGANPEIWHLHKTGGFLTDDRKGFRCSLRMPTQKEIETITGNMKKFPAPIVPLEGQYVRIRFDVDPNGELPEMVAIVTAQRFDEMTVNGSYYSIKQEKIISETVPFERTAGGWFDQEVLVPCSVSVIDRAQFEAWLASDERAQKAKAALTGKPAPTPKPSAKSDKPASDKSAKETEKK